MKLRSLFTQSASALALAAIAGSAAYAHGLHVSGLNVETVEGAEVIQVDWSAPGAVEIMKFPAADQVIIKISDAHLVDGVVNTLNSQDHPVLKNAKLQEVSLPNGQPAVQIRMNLKTWREIEMNATTEHLNLSFAGSADAPVSKQSNDTILLSNEDIEAWKAGSYGSSFAPAEGAGQSDEGSGSSLPFYVPPDLTAEEEAAANPVLDVGFQSTEDLFNQNVNLDFKNAELENVIRSIANKLDMNIILMPGDISGNVTVSLTNVRLGDAFDVMLKANDLAYKIEPGGIVRIVPRSEVQANEKETVNQVITVNWLNASELQGILQGFLSDVGTITTHNQSNTLIVEDVPEKVAQIQGIIQRIDVPEKQVRMETRLVDMSESAFRGLGFQNNIISQDVQSFASVEGGEVDFDDVINRSDLVGAAGGVVARGSGVDITSLSDFTFMGNRYNLESRLTAAETRGEAVTLAAPTIVSLNNVTALIEIKRQIPYIDATNTDQGSVASVSFVDVGTLVEITPRITNNGYVVMDILPEQSIQVGTDAVTSTPIIDERTYESSVIAKDEQTIVVGGLRQFESNTGEAGVPWILRAPVLGWFFKTNTNNQNRVELFLFVTPTIIKDPEPTTYERAVYDKIDYNWDLPDYYFDTVEARKSDQERINPYAKNDLLNE